MSYQVPTKRPPKPKYERCPVCKAHGDYRIVHVRDGRRYCLGCLKREQALAALVALHDDERKAQYDQP